MFNPFFFIHMFQDVKPWTATAEWFVGFSPSCCVNAQRQDFTRVSAKRFETPVSQVPGGLKFFGPKGPIFPSHVMIRLGFYSLYI